MSLSDLFLSPDKANLTRDETAASLTQGGVTVTVGQLRNGSDPNSGILITNNTASDIEVRSDGASLLANGNPVVWVNTTLGNILNSQNGQLEVKLTLAGQNYAYRFDAVTRSMNEHLNERGKRTARARDAAKD